MLNAVFFFFSVQTADFFSAFPGSTPINGPSLADINFPVLAVACRRCRPEKSWISLVATSRPNRISKIDDLGSRFLPQPSTVFKTVGYRQQNAPSNGEYPVGECRQVFLSRNRHHPFFIIFGKRHHRKISRARFLRRSQHRLCTVKSKHTYLLRLQAKT